MLHARSKCRSALHPYRCVRPNVLFLLSGAPCACCEADSPRFRWTLVKAGRHPGGTMDWLHRFAVTICIPLILIGATQAAAAVIYNNGAPNQSDADESDFSAQQQIGDNFALATSATLRHIDWWGLYADHNTPPATDDFTIRVFNISAGTPSTIPFYEFHLGNAASRAPTGNSTVGFTEYSYAADVTPVALLAGLDYLFSVVNNTPDPHDRWFWSLTTHQDGLYYRFSDGQAWTASPFDVAFVLSDTISQVPEPTTLALLAVGLAGLGFSRRKRAASYSSTERCARSRRFAAVSA